MRRDLAREQRVDLSHPLLDEGVTDTVDQRDAPCLLDRPRDGPARADVVDHRRTRLLVEHRAGEERRHEVARDELAGVVDEEAAVGVAVVRDAQVGALGARPLDDERPVLGEQRIRLVVRERAVGIEEAPHDLELRKALEHLRQHRPGHPVRRVDDDPEGPDRARVDEREHLRDEAVPDVRRGHRAATRDVAEPCLRAAPHVLEPGVAADRERPGADDLHPGVLLRVVRCGDDDAAVEAELADGVVEHLGADHPEVEDVGAAVRGAVDSGCRHRRRAEHACRARPRSSPARSARRTRDRPGTPRPRRSPSDGSRGRRTP